jgi:GNAT superfamily N-acetyltransferase
LIGRTGLYTIVRLADADSNAYLGKRGFTEVLRDEEVSLTLGEVRPDATAPEGVEVVPFGPELDERVHPVAVEIDRDTPAAEPIAPLSLDAWRDRMLGPGVLRELSFVALTVGEVVGYAIVGEDEPGVAEHWMTGVRRDWRGRGLGRALKATQIEAAQRAGLLELRTQFESVHAPMQRICEQLGYRPRLTWLHLTGPLLL